MTPLLPFPLALALANPAAAEPAAYALLVGSNQAGPGQTALSHADEDAARMGAVLTELGDVPAAQVWTLQDPSRAQLEEALDRLGGIAAVHRADGEPVRVVFYYSGHAKSDALWLGHQSVPLNELRARLEGVGADLTLVVLDACQSGAVSSVKGAAPAAQFSTASVAGLETQGLVVMASSTGSELSQESPELGGSYFTHHLVTGLRGAADEDRNGQVSLREAYAYAYHRTVIDTSKTAIGGQHPTLETELRGKGETVLTRPSGASAHLLLPPALQAEILVHHTGADTVVAELYKAAGQAVELGLAPGPYRALVRQGDSLRQCDLSLRDGERLALSTEDCDTVKMARSGAAKGGTEAYETWALEVGLSGLRNRESSYTQTLSDFGFFDQSAFGDSTVGLHGAAVYSPHKHFSAVLQVADMERRGWSRTTKDLDENEHEVAFDWIAWRITAGGRASAPLANGWIVPYAQVGLGPGIASSYYRDDGEETPEHQWGFHMVGSVGTQLMVDFGNFRHFGLFAEYSVSYAPVMTNLLDDRHDSGGRGATFGLRISG